MDPISAIGIVSAALNFVTFSASLIKGSVKIHDSVRTEEAGARSWESVIRELQRFTTTLSIPTTLVSLTTHTAATCTHLQKNVGDCQIILSTC
ncbi:hypothetical protein B0T21DRAFT_82089 [Apiosordaria backusii]|uniref:Uncharacterized protein n=1 Tax=Apiosordaria backusii TaxID=314023 RepID=A0AA40DPN0_9PEZI|nr:hypothetical protein B0T21DRAFT_82089 [Apiosordaria backusii]